MILQFLRTIFLGFLIMAGLLDYKITMQKEWLWIIVSAILIALLTVDVITAFIFLLIIVIVYLKIYHTWVEPSKRDFREFTTEENLSEIQSNVVNDVEDYKGITGVYGEDVYSAQGSL
jgi:membrane protein implicated in regulation of membrane protease activity